MITLWSSDRPTRSHTTRLRLRPLTTADVPDLLAYRGDPEVCRYLPFAPMDERVLTARLAGDLGRRVITAEGDAITLGAALATTGRVVGDVVLFLRSAVDAAGEIGYVFHPDVAGQGYATEACRALLTLAFDELGLRRVSARLDPHNSASLRLLSRLGFSPTPLTGEPDLVGYELTDQARRTGQDV